MYHRFDPYLNAKKELYNTHTGQVLMNNELYIGYSSQRCSHFRFNNSICYLCPPKLPPIDYNPRSYPIPIPYFPSSNRAPASHVLHSPFVAKPQPFRPKPQPLSSHHIPSNSLLQEYSNNVVKKSSFNIEEYDELYKRRDLRLTSSGSEHSSSPSGSESSWSNHTSSTFEDKYLSENPSQNPNTRKEEGFLVNTASDEQRTAFYRRRSRERNSSPISDVSSSWRSSLSRDDDRSRSPSRRTNKTRKSIWNPFFDTKKDICTFSIDEIRSSPSKDDSDKENIRNTPSPLRFVCQVCLKRFKRKSNLDRHFRLHTGEKPYLCPTCGIGFSQVANLHYHERIHSEVRPYPCPCCNKSFRNSSHLKRHFRIHSGERPYKCLSCQEAFTSWDQKRRHVKLRHEQQVTSSNT